MTYFLGGVIIGMMVLELRVLPCGAVCRVVLSVLR